MSPITTALTDVFRRDALARYVAGKTIKVALYTSAANFDRTMTGYTPTNEVAAGGGYVAGGFAITPTVSLQGGVGTIDFPDYTIPNSTITARGCVVYDDSTVGKPVLGVFDFGSDRTSSSGDFLIDFPASGAGTSTIRYQ